MKPDEADLWAALHAGEQPRYAGQRLGISPKRVEYLCHKWARKGVYDFGVVHDLGWLNGGSASETIKPTHTNAHSDQPGETS